MYFPVGWSKVLNVPNLNTCSIRQILCNRDKILFAILTDDTLSIYFGKPCLPIVLHRRTQESIEDIGTNESVQWRPDSSSICVATSGGYLIIYKLHVGNEQKGLYQLVDSPQPNLRRDSAELFIKEVIPSLQLTLQHRMYEYKFYLYYRMSVASFDELLGAVCDKIRRSGTVMKRSIEPAERLVITLSATKMLIWELPNREKDSILFFQEKNILQINRKCTSFHEMKLYLGASILWKNKKRMKHKCLSIMEAEFRLMIFLWLSLFVGAIGFSDILAKTCKVFVDKQGAEHEVAVGGGILSMVCIRDELMLATTRGHVVRYRWDGTENRDYCLDLRRVPFCIDQQVAKAVPIVENNTYIIDMEYSPLIGGFAIVLNDGRAAFLTSSNLMFDPNVQGIWAQNIDDATCATVNHKYRLITFGRKNSQAAVFEIDEVSGGLEMTHQLIVSSQVYPGDVGAVTCLRWTPDGCAVAMAWANGGFSLWSTFGSLLVCSLAWDYGLHVDLAKYNPLTVHAMEWSSEGYQLWMVKKSGCGGDYVHSSNANNNYCNSQNNSNCDFNRNCNEDSLIQLGFVKSALTVNPCMSHQAHLYLQGEDRLYVNLGAGLTKVYHIKDATDSPSPQPAVTTSLVESKTWIVILIPSTYSATNWPIKYTAIDSVGCHLAVAGRSGLAHYSLLTRKWKLFGNETQEKDMVVTGGLLWWDNYIVAGCYNLPDNQDEIRIYSRDTRLSNECMTSTQVSSQLLLLDSVRDRLLVFCADSFITIYVMTHISNGPSERSIGLNRLQIINISALRVHPACVVSVTLQTEPGRRDSTYGKDSFLLNVSGRLLSVHQHNNNQSQVLAAPTVLASCVENVWVPSKFCRNKPHLTEALWLFCGSHGMRVWLPLFPRDGHKGHGHTFMSKRVMLPFHLKIYPLAILFEDAILLGAENDTVLYSSDSSSPFSLPFCTLERTSQVYLHQILRQLIRRNLGFHAWEIARCCTGLPYFSHSLELLLHEVLEEEATSKEPIPDAQLPSVVEFIQEFPVYLETVVQCARKTEIALWPYLFSAAGKPKDLFQECLARKQLETAASYLIILQNLESSTVSRQYATILLDSTLENGKWELSKDLVRFLKAIDPNDVESPRTSFIMPSKYGMMPQSPPVAPNEEDLSLVLGSMQVSRGRSFSTTVNPKIQSVDTPQSGSATAHHIDISTQRRKKSVPTGKSDNRDSSVSSSVGCGSDSAEEFFMDVVIQRHARRLLCQHQLSDLGRMSAHLYFPLVGWLARERQRAARVDAEHFVAALRHLHSDFSWPYPQLLNNTNTNAPPNQTKGSVTSGSSLRSSPTIEERVKGVDDVTTLDSRVGDSGYMSQDPLFPLRLPYCTQPIPGDDRSIISENESWYYDNDMEAVSNETWNVIPSVQLLEQVNLQISQYNKGSSKSEVQLRYLLQIFLEAGCLEWSLLIAVLLQDAMAAHRTTTIAARSPDQTYEAINRLKEGIIALFQWSATECYGYKPFMMVIQSQVVVLNRFLTTKQRSATPPPDTTSHPPQQTRSRTSSCTYDGGGAGVGGGASQSQPTAASVTPTEQQSAESAVSQLEESRPHSPLPSHFNQVTEQSSCTIS